MTVLLTPRSLCASSNTSILQSCVRRISESATHCISLIVSDDIVFEPANSRNRLDGRRQPFKLCMLAGTDARFKSSPIHQSSVCVRLSMNHSPVVRANRIPTSGVECSLSHAVRNFEVSLHGSDKSRDTVTAVFRKRLISATESISLATPARALNHVHPRLQSLLHRLQVCVLVNKTFLDLSGRAHKHSDKREPVLNQMSMASACDV